MTTLTLDKIHAMMDRLKAMPPVPPPVTLWPSDHWPRDYVGDEVYSYRWHPFWQWLARVTRRAAPLSMERGRPIYHDKPMVMEKQTGRVYCSHRQYHEVKRAVAAQNL